MASMEGKCVEGGSTWHGPKLVLEHITYFPSEALISSEEFHDVSWDLMLLIAYLLIMSDSILGLDMPTICGWGSAKSWLPRSNQLPSRTPFEDTACWASPGLAAKCHMTSAHNAMWTMHINWHRLENFTHLVLVTKNNWWMNADDILKRTHTYICIYKYIQYIYIYILYPEEFVFASKIPSSLLRLGLWLIWGSRHSRKARRFSR